ncbi:uncharacterized protein LOC126677120 [Mercurialis annua]|uniref:uncharacterized protein LOC126677120 n=1 Tax=Mercurialis annua TaxID=3986 RepID=UPI00215EE22A|nr:uncharacterized protein LOC126677120 [Mercurialis annua]XP_050227550.1 uncharacterized protein LOC126677120 [Mercurialis annua]
MGRLFQIFDFNQGTMARKIPACKRHVDAGLEAPRNSLELQVETYQSCYAAGNEVVEEDWSGKKCIPIEASMKRLIHEEMSKQSNIRRNAPSIVARLMGVDMLPLDTKPVVQAVDKSNRSTATKLGKPRPREHPQEEELQKFKKDFEAWQAARFKECSKVAEPDHFARENFSTRKLAQSENFGMSSTEKHRERASLRHSRHKVEVFPIGDKESFSSRKKNMHEHSLISYDHQLDKTSAPTKIVILKPGPDRFYDYEDSCTSSSCTLEDRGSIADFLEEVKERLKCELQGKTIKRGSVVVRGSGIETPYSEKPSHPKQIAQHIAKHVRESVTQDLGMNLLRSESTRSYRSEIQYNGLDSAEFMNKDTRKYLSERLRNVVDRETHSLCVPLVASGRLDDQEMQTRSFRHGDDNELLHRDMSPRNLVRSLSAPVSGTSFGKLLLEDRHVLTGAHIRRKHEALGDMTMELKKRKKERFNIKEKVSNFKGRLFRRKLHSSHGSEQDFVKDIMSGPTVVRNFGDRYTIMENSTEVPPSPVSVCSSVQEELWRPVDYLSPVSTSDVTPLDDTAMPQVFKEISSNLNELRRQLNQLESNELDSSKIGLEPSNECIMFELGDKVEAYIRDLLVTSGLYDGSRDTILSRWDPLAKPISEEAFNKVEKSCTKLSKDDNQTSTKDHKLLYDLLNEALSIVLGPPVTMSRFRRKVISFSTTPPLRGTKLLDSVWEIIRAFLYPPEDDKSYYSLDNLVEKNLGSTPWSGLVDDELNVLAKEMEFRIMGDLIEEIVNDMHL